MVINFRVRGINRGTCKLTRTSILIKKIRLFTNRKICWYIGLFHCQIVYQWEIFIVIFIMVTKPLILCKKKKLPSNFGRWNNCRKKNLDIVVIKHI